MLSNLSSSRTNNVYLSGCPNRFQGNKILFQKKPNENLVVCRCSPQAQIVEVNSSQLKKEVSNRTKPLIIDFYATWCGPCKMLAVELKKVASSMGDSVRILKIDVDQNKEMCTKLKINSFPTILVMGSRKTPGYRIVGFKSAEAIEKLVREKEEQDVANEMIKN